MRLFKIRKLLRFITIYGIGRTLNKAFGRLRFVLPFSLSFKKIPDTGLIGCGQFAFSTICYFLRKLRGNHFSTAFDIEPIAANSLVDFYGFRAVANSADEVIQNPNINYLYIASNHASHSDYAVKGLLAGKAVYVEKPIAVTHEQFKALLDARQKCENRLFAGYNRPYSKAVRTLKAKFQFEKLHAQNTGFTLSYFINGHVLASDHWYRKPEEGTRICGNVGHWLDLSIHILAWRSIPEQFNIQIAYSDEQEFDENLTISITTELKDLITITLTARKEPFEGISESINLQYDSLIARIDDFRRMQYWFGDQTRRFRYFPKDVGHKRAISQPFLPKEQVRDFEEVILSTALMLKITDLVRQRATQGYFSSNISQH